MKVKIERDEIVDKVCENYTYEFNEYVTFNKHNIDKKILPKHYNIGLIVGSSGSGKSILLKDMFTEKEKYIWDKNKAVCSHFKTYEEAEKMLMGVGLNSIPSWLKPYNTLSNGQQYRADLAINLNSCMGVDEFTSVIDRATALGLSNSIQKIVFASVHKDIIPFLNPDWIYDTDDKTLTVNSKIYDMDSFFMEIK